jgi:phosphoglycerate dehydrogenase-like enzyme
MNSPRVARIAVGPPGSPPWAIDAVVAGGCEVVDVADANGLIWIDYQQSGQLGEVLKQHPNIEWVQLPYAGIEEYLPFISAQRLWTSAKGGVYSGPVAELAVALLLGGMRYTYGYARKEQWSEDAGRTLIGARVTVLGGGGIAQTIIDMLQPFSCHITVVRKHVQPMPGVATVVDTEHLADALTGADAVVMAMALTDETAAMIGRTELELMASHTWIVNVGRGKHIDTDALVWALENNIIGGAALDVTDPEPLPQGHALWSLDNCVITPHVGNTADMVPALLGPRITANVKLFAAGQPLLGVVDPTLGY